MLREWQKLLNYKLRPHYALCLSFFEGKGYSNEFVENMAIIYSSLKKEDQITVTQTTYEQIISIPTTTKVGEVAA